MKGMDNMARTSINERSTCTLKLVFTLRNRSILKTWKLFKSLNDKSGVGMISSTKQTFQLLMGILAFLSYFELSNGCPCLEQCEN